MGNFKKGELWKRLAKINSVKPSPALFDFLLNFPRYIEEIKVVEPDIAIIKTCRSEWGRTGSIGYFDQITVYYHGKTETQEWQRRDRWSANNDRPWLSIHGIGDVKVQVENGGVKIEIELINRRYGNRWARFACEKVEQEQIVLTEQEREKFKRQVDLEINKEMDKGQPQKYYSSYWAPAYVQYSPRIIIKEKIIRADIGIAAWVTEEQQIDNWLSMPQMRYKLYVMKYGEEPKVVLEDHSYEYEGSAVIAIVSLEVDKVVANTRHGKKTIEL